MIKMQRRASHSFAIICTSVISTLCCFSFLTPALAYSREMHFDLTLYLALKVPCTDLSEALLIASSDWSQDTNQSMVAERDPIKVLTLNVPNQRAWHAFETQNQETATNIAAHKEMLWQKIANAQSRSAQLHALGQLLHYDQDSFSHKGFEPGLGHALPTFFGHDPDSLAYPDKNQEAISRILATTQSTLFWLTRACNMGSRNIPEPEITNTDTELFKTLMQNSDASWRAGSFFGISELGRMGEQLLYKKIAEALPKNRLPEIFKNPATISALVNASLEWLHVIVNENGQAQNLEELEIRLNLIREGGVPPPIPSNDSNVKTRKIFWGMC